MDAPRTRYKVVERGRRLEVIDTWNGNAAVNPVRAEPSKRRSDVVAAANSLNAPRRDAPAPVEAGYAPKLDSRGRGLLQTRRWYDDKGPRQIVVTTQGAEKLKGIRFFAMVLLFIAAVFAYLMWPVSLLAVFFLFSGGARKGLRAAATKFLDELNQPPKAG